MVVAHGLEKDMRHGILGCDSLSVVVSQHLAQQVESLVRHQMIVLRIDKFAPRLTWDRIGRQQVFVVRVQRQSILVQVRVKFLRAEHLRNLHELVVVVAALEERLSFEYHASEHAAQRPNIERVVVGLQVDKQLGSLEVARGHADIVLLARMVELSQAPVDQAQLAVRVVNHNVVRLHITVHNSFRVTVVERFQDLEHVVADVEIIEALVEFAEISVTCVDKFRDDGRRLGERVAHHIDQLNDVDTVL